MVSVILLVVAVGALAQCGLSDQLAIRGNYTSVLAGFNLKQRIAFRIGQVECLKTLLSEGEYRNAQYGLGALHRGNYTKDISSFDLKQRIAFLLGQVQCLKLQASLGVKNDSTQQPPAEEYLDCRDAHFKGQTTSGIYTIKPDNQPAFQVYCDMDTDGGGWTVFQRRMDGSVNFLRNWTDYEQGFGNLTGEHWLGLRQIHRLTPNFTSSDLRVDLGDFEGNTSYAQYESFSVTGASDKYRLQLSIYSGTAGDSLGHHVGAQFTTPDQDNDRHRLLNCAMFHKGAWWYTNCLASNLNGVYYHSGDNTPSAMGVNWGSWRGYSYSLKFTEMKVRRN